MVSNRFLIDGSYVRQQAKEAVLSFLGPITVTFTLTKPPIVVPKGKRVPRVKRLAIDRPIKRFVKKKP